MRYSACQCYIHDHVLVFPPLTERIIAAQNPEIDGL